MTSSSASNPTPHPLPAQLDPALTGLDKLVAVVACLRHPEKGCPWDLKQTHHTLRPYMLEEAYEAVEAIDTGNPDLIKEELGDVLLQVMLHAQIAKDEQRFDVDDVADGIAEKLIRRHPHVFGDVTVENAEEVTANWEDIKAQEKAAQGKTQQESIMDNLPNGLPALMRAHKVSKRAVKEGFEWPDFDSLWACVLSEFDELKAEIDQNSPHEEIEDELGDILFATVNLARQLKVDPEVALTKATNKFITRYRTMEQITDKPISQQSFEELDALWEHAKAKVRKDISRESK